MEQASINAKRTGLNHCISVLIASRPDRRRDGVRAMLKAIPHLKIINQADDGPTALKMMADHRPALVLLDSNLPDGTAWTVLKQIKTEWPQTLCLALIDTIDQRSMAETVGADGILMTEFSMMELGAAIVRVLTK